MNAILLEMKQAVVDWVTGMVSHLECKPEHGIFSGILSFVIGYFPEFLQNNKDFITFCFQITAFTVTIVASGLTIYAKVKDLKNKKKKKNCK